MAREHNGRFGKFYSSWAFDEKEREMAAANAKVYDAIAQALDILPEQLRRRKGKNPDGHGEEPFIYRSTKIENSLSEFRVIDMPDWMTMAEAALVIDRGNLCFGFTTGGETVVIFTD